MSLLRPTSRYCVVASGLLVLSVLLCGLAAGVGTGWAAERPKEGQSWRYLLLGASTYLDDCPPCGRPSILLPLRGRFEATPGESDPLFERLTLKAVSFSVGGEDPDSLRLEGQGVLEWGGEVALVHRVRLTLTLQGGGRPAETVEFDSGFLPGVPEWPRISADLTEVNPSLTRVLHLHLESMPVQDLWFSTRSGFTAERPGPTPQPISPADVLSVSGQVVVSHRDLADSLGLVDSPSALNVDALEVTSGGELWTSFNADLSSKSLGVLHHGDLVSSPSRRVKSYRDFAAAVAPEPPAPDLGLDAVQAWEGDGWLFSIRDTTFSETLGDWVGRGDLMTTRGVRVGSFQELLQAFGPVKPAVDPGLDALLVWPSGEVWFSTQDGVELSDGRFLLEGDLLSSRGEVVFRNLELVRRFAPLEDAASFGLDGLTVVSDAMESSASAPVVTIRSEGAMLILSWTRPGRFFQVESASSPDGPFVPLGGIGVEGERRIPAPGAAMFFRVRQW